MKRAHAAAWAHARNFRYYRNNGATHATTIYDLTTLRNAVEQQLDLAIVDMRDNGKYSFTEIGEALGVSRQAATKRYQSVTQR